MNEPNADKPPDTSAIFAQRVGAAANRKRKAQQAPNQGVWFGLGMIGLIGWSIVVPALLGTGIGMWLDKNHVGRHSWTLALMVGGLCLGCMNAWHWVAEQDRAMRQEEPNDRH